MLKYIYKLRIDNLILLWSYQQVYVAVTFWTCTVLETYPQTPAVLTGYPWFSLPHSIQDGSYCDFTDTMTMYTHLFVLIGNVQADYHSHLLSSYISSKLVALLEFTYATIPISDIFICTVCFKLITFVFHIFHSLFLKHLLVSHLMFALLILLGHCNHCNLACLLLFYN
jgi:hypothetical protein